jgi:hypothetical protein
MRTAHDSGDAAALERLRAEEAALDRRMDQARRDAAARAAEADRQIVLIREESAGALAAELERLDRSARIELERRLAASAAETSCARERLRARLVAGREEAIALVLAAIGREGAP